MLTPAIYLLAIALPYDSSATRLSSDVTATTTFGCDAPLGHYCSFALFPAGSFRLTFRLESGQRSVIRATPGVDRYVVTIDAPPAQIFEACPHIRQSGRFCKEAVVRVDYNN